MTRSRRQLLAYVALAVAGVASLATSQAPPSISQEAKDHLSFGVGQHTEVRHVRIEVRPGADSAQVTAEVDIEIGGVNGKRPVTLTVTRGSDGMSILNDFEPGYQVGTTTNVSGAFDAFDGPCPNDQTCTELFTLTFTRIAEDTRPTLAFDWSVRTSADFNTLATPPPEASLTVSITP